MGITFINSLIPKRRQNLENAQREVERIRSEMRDSEKTDKVINHELGLILSWADTFDDASRETQRSIIARLIERIDVHTEYQLDIHLRITAEQYRGKAS